MAKVRKTTICLCFSSFPTSLRIFSERGMGGSWNKNGWDSVHFVQHLWSSGVTSVVCSLSMKSIKSVFIKVIPVTKIKINIIFHCKFTELFERNPAVYIGYCWILLHYVKYNLCSKLHTPVTENIKPCPRSNHVVNCIVIIHENVFYFCLSLWVFVLCMKS